MIVHRPAYQLVPGDHIAPEGGRTYPLQAVYAREGKVALCYGWGNLRLVNPEDLVEVKE